MYKLTFDTAKFDKQIAKYQAMSNVAAEKGVQSISRIWLKSAIAISPPKGQGAKLSISQRKKLGERQVENDAKKLFVEWPELRKKLRNWEIRYAVDQLMRRKRKRGNVIGVLEDFGFLFRGLIDDPSHDLHAKHRDRRGHIKKKERKYLVRKQGAIKRYINREKKKVGIFLSGWKKAVMGLGLRLASFAMRHSSDGKFETAKAGDKPYVIFGNSVPFANKRKDLEVMSKSVVFARKQYLKYITRYYNEMKKAESAKKLEQKLAAMQKTDPELVLQ